MRRNVHGLIAAGLGVLFAVAPLVAHHSFSAQYDSNKAVKIAGPVTRVEFQNPHIYFYVDVKDAAGKITNYAVEGGTPNSLRRRGWGKDSLKVGDIVTVEGWAAKNGKPNINGNVVTLADGRKVFAGSSNPAVPQRRNRRAIEEISMNKRIVLAAASLFVFALATTSAFAQRGGPEPPKPKPTFGAWWYRGDAPPQGATPDLTGVWSGGSMSDIAATALPGEELILTPMAAERYKVVDHAKDPNAFCLPPGPSRMVARAHPTMIAQRPDVVVIMSESEHIFRLIYMDGRPHPADAKDYPGFYGYSIGKWEGDTLVVDTISINDRTWLDLAGHEHSDQLHLTEKFRLADNNTLEYITTYTDPVFFAKPFTGKKILRRQIGEYIYDHSCLDNEKDLENLVPTLGDDGR